MPVSLGRSCHFKYAKDERFPWEVLWERKPKEGRLVIPYSLRCIICSLSGISILNSTVWPLSLLFSVLFYSLTPTVLASEVDPTSLVLSLSLLRSSLPFKFHWQPLWPLPNTYPNSPCSFLLLCTYSPKPQACGNPNCLLHRAYSPSPVKDR